MTDINALIEPAPPPPPRASSPAPVPPALTSAVRRPRGHPIDHEIAAEVGRQEDGLGRPGAREPASVALRLPASDTKPKPPPPRPRRPRRSPGLRRVPSTSSQLVKPSSGRVYRAVQGRRQGRARGSPTHPRREPDLQRHRGESDLALRGVSRPGWAPYPPGVQPGNHPGRGPL